jgi:peptidoglycan/xylan/chitin deacetylase (PgdA/CDA1 family)
MKKRIDFERVIDKSKEFRRYHLRGFIVLFFATLFMAVAFFVMVNISYMAMRENAISIKAKANESSDDFQNIRYTTVGNDTEKEYLSEEQIAAEDKWIEEEKKREEAPKEEPKEVVEIYTPPVGAKIVYLTFDDGPGPDTIRLLDTLKKYDVKATFFVTCGRAQYRDAIKRAYDEGHTIGLHTCSHDYGRIYASDEAYFNDLNEVSNLVRDITGKESKMIRFPGGSSNTVSKQYSAGIMSRLVAEVGNRGYVYFDWNVSSGDAGNIYDANSVYNNITRSLKGDYSIVLQHDIKSFSVDAVESVIKFGKQYGFTFKALDESSPTAHHRINN